MTTPFDFLRSRTIWYFALILAIYLFSGCNYFLTPCSEEVVCTTLSNPDDGGIIDMPPDPNKPIGATRKFEWRAKVQVDSATFKYAGMKGTTPIFLRNAGSSMSSWETRQLDLLRENSDQRIRLDMNRTGFPAAPSHDFVSTSILVAGSQFYWLSSTTKVIKDVGSGMEIYAGVVLPDSPPYVYFRHPELDSFAVSAKPTGTYKSAALVRWNGTDNGFIQSGVLPATALVMGDLDAADQLGNGQEVVFVSGSQIQQVRHQKQGNSPSLVDQLLQQGLQGAIDRSAPGITAPIQAGFVTDLNNDKFVDFVYVRSGRVYVTSYKERKADEPFEDWKGEILPDVVGATVRSIQAVELTNDSYPELVVETDQAVHFYLSVP